VPLTPRQRRFVEEYLIDLNATRAAVRAGYSEKTANEQGSRLLANVKVAGAVRVGRDRQQQRTEITADWVLLRLRDEAERTGEGASHSARVRALELLGRHLGLFDGPARGAGACRLVVVEEIVEAPAPGEPRILPPAAPEGCR